MSEERIFLCPIVIEVPNMIDIIESSGGVTPILHYSKDGTEYYYFYLSTEGTVITVIHKTDKKYRRYVGVKNQKLIENDIPDSDSPIPIIEIGKDEILELILERDSDEEKMS